MSYRQIARVTRYSIKNTTRAARIVECDSEREARITAEQPTKVKTAG